MENTSSQVEFNEALGIIYRLDKLQQELNDYYKNLLGVDEKGIKNYENFIHNLDTIHFEIWGDLKDDEKEQIRTIKQIINNILKYLPFEQVKEAKSFSSNKVKTFNRQRFELFLSSIQEYRKIVKDCMKAHGYGNPNKRNLSKVVASN